MELKEKQQGCQQCSVGAWMTNAARLDPNLHERAPAVLVSESAQHRWLPQHASHYLLEEIAWPTVRAKKKRENNRHAADTTTRPRCTRAAPRLSRGVQARWMAAAKLHSGDSLHKVRVANAAEDDLIKNAATPALKLSAACFVAARTKLRASVEEERDDDTQVTIFYYPHAPRDERRARRTLRHT